MRTIQAWHLRHKAITDRQQEAEGLGGKVAEAFHAFLRHGDDNAAHHTLMAMIIRLAMASLRNKFAGVVHTPKKLISPRRFCGVFASCFLVDQASREIGVDRHLLAGHGVLF